MASKATTIAELMGDRVLVEVARGALGIPKQFGTLSFEQQRDLLKRRLDVTQLQDPKFVEQLSKRYLAQLAPTAPASNVLALFDGSGGAGAIASLAARRTSFTA
jgi:hypothetical protein